MLKSASSKMGAAEKASRSSFKMYGTLQNKIRRYNDYFVSIWQVRRNTATGVVLRESQIFEWIGSDTQCGIVGGIFL
jgi:hypothetical protein